MPSIPQVIPFVVGGGGTSVNLGQATSTHTALAHTSEKVKRTHFAQPITVRTSLSATLGQPSSAGTAQAVTARKYHAVGQATTAHAAQSAGKVRPIAVGRVDSAHTAQHHSILALQGGRTHFALPISVELVFNPPIGNTSDTETAQVVRPTKVVSVSPATSASQSNALALSRTWGIGLATGSSSAQPVHARKTATLGSAASTSDTSTSTGHAKRSGVGQSTGPGLAIEVTPTRRIPVGQASSATSARVVTPQLVAAPPTEGDVATPVRASKRVAVSPPPITAAEVHAVTPRRSYGVGVASEQSDATIALPRGFENVILSSAELLPDRWRARILPARWTADIT